MLSFVDPLTVSPRLDAKLWGGSRLSTLGFEHDGLEPLGEVVATATANVVSGGRYAGRTLGQLVQEDPMAVIGPLGLASTRNRMIFPLLVKIIDAGQHLSIQVHPDNLRGSLVDSLGKTEAWSVLDAESGSTLFAGVHDGVSTSDVENAAQVGNGATAALMRRVPAAAGETMLLPAGTLHALGAGVMVYEIQQASEITYRLDDWGRVGLDGKPRTMHIAESIEAMDLRLRPGLIPAVELPNRGARREVLVACRYFALDRFTFDTAGTTVSHAAEGPQVVTAIAGKVVLRGFHDESVHVQLATGQTAVVPAALGAIEIRAEAEATVLRGWIPYLYTDVIRPAAAAGIPSEVAAALSGPLHDVRHAMAPVPY